MNNIEKEFKEKSTQLFVQPTTEAWEKISSQLPGSKNRKIFHFSTWSIAASLVLVLSIAVVFYKPGSKSKLESKYSALTTTFSLIPDDYNLTIQRIHILDESYERIAQNSIN